MKRTKIMTISLYLLEDDTGVGLNAVYKTKSSKSDVTSAMICEDRKPYSETVSKLASWLMTIVAKIMTVEVLSVPLLEDPKNKG